MYYHLHTPHEFLGFIFNFDDSNVGCQINYIQPLLAKIFRIPTRRIKLSEEQLLEIFVGATEQYIQRPKRKQKKYYSGKKKLHTIKNQVIVNPKGKILSISESNQGSTHDKKLYDKTNIYTEEKSKQIGDLGYLGISEIEIPIKKPKGRDLTK